MKLIVGLGNFGTKYTNTRHNVGFRVIENLMTKLSERYHLIKKPKKEKKFLAVVGEWEVNVAPGQKEKIILAKPHTFMNNSGEAVKKIVDWYKLEPKDVWIISDDLDLPLGKIRIRPKGGAGGHHGLESIISFLGTENFPRFRVGIRGEEHKFLTSASSSEYYVLQPFHKNEKAVIKEIIDKMAEAVIMAILEGLDKAMSRYN